MALTATCCDPGLQELIEISCQTKEWKIKKNRLLGGLGLYTVVQSVVISSSCITCKGGASTCSFIVDL